MIKNNFYISVIAEKCLVTSHTMCPSKHVIETLSTKSRYFFGLSTANTPVHTKSLVEGKEIFFSLS